MSQLLHLVPGISAVRELWLMVMGGLMVMVGTVFLTQEAWVWVKPRMVTPMLALVPRLRGAVAAQQELPERSRTTA